MNHVMTGAPASDFECEMEDHDPSADNTGCAFIPNNKGGTSVMCEACLREVFENVFKKDTQ